MAGKTKNTRLGFIICTKINRINSYIRLYNVLQTDKPIIDKLSNYKSYLSKVVPITFISKYDTFRNERSFSLSACRTIGKINLINGAKTKYECEISNNQGIEVSDIKFRIIKYKSGFKSKDLFNYKKFVKYFIYKKMR